MKYQEFKNKISKFPVFSSSQLEILGGDLQALRNQLSYWQKQGLVLKLRRGLYILNEKDRRINPSRPFLASQLYSPSYISTHYALSFYGIIPEKVADLTCITNRQTARFENKFGTFVYQHLKTEAFSGFKIIKDENNLSYFISYPEKALIDFIYFNLDELKSDGADKLIESYRLRLDEGLSPNKLRNFAKIFNNNRVHSVVCDLIDKLRK